ncbi:unnamed protein product, partial [Pieris macdunnoughi]
PVDLDRVDGVSRPRCERLERVHEDEADVTDLERDEPADSGFGDGVGALLRDGSRGGTSNLESPRCCRCQEKNALCCTTKQNMRSGGALKCE